MTDTETRIIVDALGPNVGIAYRGDGVQFSLVIGWMQAKKLSDLLIQKSHEASINEFASAK